MIKRIKPITIGRINSNPTPIVLDMLGLTGFTPTELALLLGQKGCSCDGEVGGTVGGGGGEGTKTRIQLDTGPLKSDENLGYALIAKYRGLSRRSLFCDMSMVKVVSEPGAKGKG